MIDREKVLKGLECCNERNFAEVCNCPYQPSYKSDMCLFELHADALALLKAQEPRVMEPEELGALAMDESDNVPVWYEYRIITDRGVITRLEASVLWWVEDGWWRRLGPVRMGWEDVRADGYGVSWRVWTERPTEAQREAAKWE